MSHLSAGDTKINLFESVSSLEAVSESGRLFSLYSCALHKSSHLSSFQLPASQLSNSSLSHTSNKLTMTFSVSLGSRGWFSLNTSPVSLSVIILYTTLNDPLPYARSPQ